MDKTGNVYRLTRRDERTAAKIDAVLRRAGVTAADLGAWQRRRYAAFLQRLRVEQVDALIRAQNPRAGRLA